MKTLFCHDCRFLEKDNNVYTEGGFDRKLFDRYLEFFNILTVVARLDNIDSNNVANICEENLVDNMAFIPVNINYNNVVKVVKKAVQNNDLAIIRLPSIVGTIAVYFCKKFNKSYLIELVGCPWDALWNHSWKGKLVAPFMWYATKKAVKNAPYVLYVSSNFLQKRYPNNFNNISCSDVDLQPVKQDVLDQRLEKIKNMNKNKPLVLCTIANVDVKYKRQDLVIKAISELNIQGYNFEYRLVGGGNTNHLQSIAEKYGVVDKVIFEGSVPHERIFDYLDDIDIYVQPSQTEGLPRALIEAMSRGCPCIGSNAGGIPELLDTTFIFNSGNVKELANILASFDTEKMIKQAKRNFEFSKGYAKKVLEARRNEFLLSFKKYADQDLQGENK